MTPETEHGYFVLADTSSYISYMPNEADFNSLWAEGRALTIEQAIEYAPEAGES